jgi:hypothetical protein
VNFDNSEYLISEQIPLSVISRIINLRTFESIRKGPTDELSFWNLPESVLQSCKEQEAQKGGPLDIQVRYSADMSMLSSNRKVQSMSLKHMI